MTSLFPHLSRRPAACPRANAIVSAIAAPRAAGHAAADAARDEACDDGHRAACGWFDSSHDLLAGLSVTELAAPEAAAELPRFVR